MYIALKEFLFDGKTVKQGAAFDARGVAPIRLRALEAARLIGVAPEKTLFRKKVAK